MLISQGVSAKGKKPKEPTPTPTRTRLPVTLQPQEFSKLWPEPYTVIWAPERHKTYVTFKWESIESAINYQLCNMDYKAYQLALYVVGSIEVISCWKSAGTKTEIDVAVGGDYWRPPDWIWQVRAKTNNGYVYANDGAIWYYFRYLLTPTPTPTPSPPYPGP